MEISEITLDGPVTLEAGKSYGLLVAKPSEVTFVHPLVTVPGSSSIVTLVNPIDDADAVAPDVGDHIVIGELGSETISCIVRDIEPIGNLEARISLVPEAPAIHSAGDVLPDFDPGITRTASLPAPVVASIESGATVMIRTADGTLLPRIMFGLLPVAIDGITPVVLYRIFDTDQPFQRAAVQSFDSREVIVAGVEEGETYDFRLFYTHPDYFASLPANIDAQLIAGSQDIPEGLTGVVANAIGGSILLRWDKHPAVDVRYGGRIFWRWSPETVVASAEWQASVSIGREVDGGSTHAYLPLKPGTYLARVYDSGGRVSDDIAKVSTKQASAITWSPVDEVIEHTAFAGTLTNLTKVGSTIKLEAGSFDDVPDVDALGDFDDSGMGVATTGTYDFAAGFDFLSVTKARLTTHIAALTENVYDFIDHWPDIDGRDDIDGTTGAPVDAWVEIRQTDDDPAGSPTWAPWERLDASEIEARGIDLRLILLSDDRSFNLIVSELSVAAEEII